jgi:hypothetical protein
MRLGASDGTGFILTRPAVSGCFLLFAERPAAQRTGYEHIGPYQSAIDPMLAPPQT